MSLTGITTSHTITGTVEQASVVYAEVAGPQQLKLLQPPGTVGGASWRQLTTTLNPQTNEATVLWVRDIGRIKLNEG
jgi:hypothetical protein